MTTTYECHGNADLSKDGYRKNADGDDDDDDDDDDDVGDDDGDDGDDDDGDNDDDAFCFLLRTQYGGWVAFGSPQELHKAPNANLPTPVGETISVAMALGGYSPKAICLRSSDHISGNKCLGAAILKSSTEMTNKAL